LKDLARYTGFSITTISLVLNNNANSIPDSVKQQIIDAAKELNYVPNFAARSLVSGSSKTIGIIIPDISNNFFSTLVHDIQIELNKNQYDILLGNSDEKMENDINYIKLFNSRGVDGMILVLSAESLDKNNYDYVKSILDTIHVPYIFVDRYLDDDTYKVMIDNYEGGRIVAEEMYSLGHRNVGLITGPLSLNSSKNRLSGFIDYFKSKGIEIDDSHIYKGKYDINTGYLGVQELLKQKVTSIFTFNDLQAYGVIDYCKKNNISLPQNMSLIGFDNQILSDIISPKLTSVEQPVAELSIDACNILMNLINEKTPSKVIKLNPKLIIRESVRDINNGNVN